MSFPRLILSSSALAERCASSLVAQAWRSFLYNSATSGGYWVRHLWFIIVLLYFGLPNAGLELSGFVASWLALTLVLMAFAEEIFWAGITSVPKGQWEAGKVLGLSYLKTMRFIVMPQAIRHMLPAFGNEFVSLIKESSLLSTLAITELTMAGQQVRSATYASFETFIVVGILYFCMTSIATGCLRFLERRWSVY